MRKSQEWKLLPPCVCLSFPVCLFFGVFFQLHLRKKVSYGAQHAPSALPNQTSNINLRSRILSRKIASHTRTHTQTRTQRDCNCKQWGPICLLRCWPRGPNSNITQSRQKTGYFQQCHSVFFLLCKIAIYEIFQSMGAPIPVLSLWMHAWAKLPWCDWKAFPRQQPVPIEVNSMCHDKPNDCTNHTQVSNMHACVCTWNREDSDQLLFWQEPLLNPVDVLSVNWKPQLADRNLSNQVRHHCLSFL